MKIMANPLERYTTILELSKEHLSVDEIHKAYRRLALKYHPDKNVAQEANERFIEICKAYSYLMTKYSNFVIAESINAPILVELQVSLTGILQGCTLKKQIIRYRITSNKRMSKECKTFEIKIIPGMHSGTKIHFPHEGNQLSDESLPGHVIFVIVDKANSKFKRVNHVNIEYTAKVSQRKYFSGGVVEIPTLENELVWKQINSKILQKGCIRLSRRGLPFANDPHQRGDLIVRFKLNVDVFIKLEKLIRLYFLE